MSNCSCGGQWMYTTEYHYEDSGCDTCGGYDRVKISRECRNCRVPQVIERELSTWEIPQEFASPEFDTWFPNVWEKDGGPQRLAKQQAEARAAKKERDRRADVERRAMSFLPPEYRKDRT